MEDALKQRIMDFCKYLKEQDVPLNAEQIFDTNGAD